MKKGIIIAVMTVIYLGLSACGQIKEENTAKVEDLEYYIFPNVSDEKLTDADLYLLGDFSLSLAKNEPFARKGYIFTNSDSQAYFDNMLWYVPNENVKGELAELNETEQQNVELIDEHLRLREESRLKYYEARETYGCEKVSEEAVSKYVQKVNADFDQDGENEELTANFFIMDVESEITVDIYKAELVITDGDREYSVQYEYPSIETCIKIADFDITDGLVQFYLEAYGPSGDPYTQIYSFDGEQIIENTGIIGYITGYDGKAKLHSFEEYDVNCYYDLNKGLVPLPKENMVGSVITRCTVNIFEKPYTELSSNLSSDYMSEPGYQYQGAYENEYVGTVIEGTEMTVLDIEFEYSEESGYSPVPWIKIKTPEGVEGWFCIAYGD